MGKQFVLLVLTAIAAMLLFANHSTAARGCDRSYPGVCIPSAPPDLNCPDISYRNFKVRPPDPHRFDRDNDGIGCEKQ